MKHIKSFNNFLNEADYAADSSNIFDSVFTKIINRIKNWFGVNENDDINPEGDGEEGELKKLQLYDIDKNTPKGYMMFNFSDDQFYFQVQIVVPFVKVTNESDVQDANLVIKKYDINKTTIINKKTYNFKLEEMESEDFLLAKIAELDDNYTEINKAQPGSQSQAQPSPAQGQPQAQGQSQAQAPMEF